MKFLSEYTKYARPPIKVSEVVIIFIPATIIAIIVTIWFLSWLPHTDVESARWALSTQAQSSAAILGLLIVAVVFRWRTMANQEEDLRKSIYIYLKELGRDPASLEKAYDVELSNTEMDKLKGEKREKIGFQRLGRIYVLKKLSLIYGQHEIKTIERYLRRDEVEALSSVNNQPKHAAIDMMDSFFRYPAKFMVKMFDTLSVHSNEHKSISLVVEKMLSDNTVLVGQHIEFTKPRLLSILYLTCTILIIAIVISITALSTISSTAIAETLGPHWLRLVVGLAIGLSIFGIYFCLMTIYVALR